MILQKFLISVNRQKSNADKTRINSNEKGINFNFANVVKARRRAGEGKK